MFFLRNAGLLFDGREKALHAFRDEIFPFKMTDRHPDDLERPLTPEPPTTAPIIGYIRYTSIPYTIETTRTAEIFGHSSKIHILQCPTQGKGLKVIPLK